MTTETRSPEEMLSDAMNHVRVAYWAHVRDIAENITYEAKRLYDEGQRGEELRESVDEYLWSSIDGDGWVIYTAKAQAVLLCSDNDGAYADDFWGDGMVKDGTIWWSRLAFCALRADVVERLDAEGLDLNDPAAKFESEEEDEEPA